jgi:hypothetical protein
MTAMMSAMTAIVRVFMVSPYTRLRPDLSPSPAAEA